MILSDTVYLTIKCLSTQGKDMAELTDQIERPGIPDFIKR